MVTVHIPSRLRRLTDGRERVELPAETLGQLLLELVARYPDTRGLLLDGAPGEVSRFVGVFVNGEDYRGLGGTTCRLEAGDRVDLLLPLAGG